MREIEIKTIKSEYKILKPSLEFKTVRFQDMNLLGIKKDNKIYTSIKRICEEIGIDYSRQYKKIKDNDILNKGIDIMSIPSAGGKQESLCLDVDLLPFWLSNINPKKVREEIKPYLIDFQLKVTQLLKNAFMDYEGIKKETSTPVPQLPTTYLEALKALVQSEEQKQVLFLESEEKQKQIALLAPKAQAFDGFMSATNSLTFSAAAKSYGIGRNKLFEFCREKKILMSNNEPYQKYIDLDYFEVKIISIKRSDNSFNTTQTFITAKGQEYIYKLLVNDGVIKKQS